MSRSLLIIDKTPGGGHSSKVGRPYQPASPYALDPRKRRSRHCAHAMSWTAALASLIGVRPLVTDCCSDPGDDLDPSLVHRLEPLSLLLGILVWDGADEVVAPAVLVDLVGCRSMMILSTSISVSARRSLSRQVLPRQRWVGQLRHGRLAGRAACAPGLADHVPRRSPPSPLETSWRSTSPRSFIRSASFFCSCRCAHLSG